MAKHNQQKNPIYKLAELGTSRKDQELQDGMVKIEGTGIDRLTLKYKFSKKKFITTSEAKALKEIAKDEEDAKWFYRYQNTIECLDKITTHDGKAFGKFCKNRCCLNCCSIRKAMYVNKFLPIIQSWNDPYFVTLTCKAKSKYKLKKWIRQLITNFDLINRRLRKRHERGKGPKPIGIRALECNYNPIKYTYNPHLHLILESKELAVDFILEWQNTFDTDDTDPRAQHMRPVSFEGRDLIETIKYGAKIFTDPDMIKDKKKRIQDPIIYIAALHNIYKAMDGCHLLSTFGFKQPEAIKEDEQNSIITNDFEDWFYDPKLKDWVNAETAQIMTQYKPDGKLEYLLEERMDKIKD